jgi:hypothetical protein
MASNTSLIPTFPTNASSPSASNNAASPNVAETTVLHAIETDGPAILKTAVNLATSGTEEDIEETTGLEFSSLKTASSFFSGLVGWLFTSSMLRRFTVVNWSNARTKGNITKNLASLGSNSKAMIRTCIVNRGLECTDEALAAVLEQLLRREKSPLTKGIEDTQNGISSAESRKFQNISEWPGATTIAPTQVRLAEFYSIADLYVITAINQVANPDIARKLGKSIDSTTPFSEQAIRLLEDMRSKAKGANVRGTTATDSIDKAIHILREVGERITSSAYWMNYETALPAGSHLAYEFSGGALHHAIYLGSNILVEVTNNKTPDERTGSYVKGYVAITHLFDFLKRMRNSPSAVFRYKYENPYPLDLIKRRALWALGLYNYHIRNANCESFANWVFMNKMEADMCTIGTKSILRKNSTGRRVYASIGRRMTRKNKGRR